MKCNGESDAASQDAQRIKTGYSNARIDEPARHFSGVVAYGEIAGPCNLDGLHSTTPVNPQPYYG